MVENKDIRSSNLKLISDGQADIQLRKDQLCVELDQSINKLNGKFNQNRQFWQSQIASLQERKNVEKERWASLKKLVCRTEESILEELRSQIQYSKKKLKELQDKFSDKHNHILELLGQVKDLQFSTGIQSQFLFLLKIQ